MKNQKEYSKEGLYKFVDEKSFKSGKKDLQS
jgi:hypothetical protein